MDCQMPVMDGQCTTHQHRTHRRIKIPCCQNLDLGCVLVSDPSTFGAGRPNLNTCVCGLVLGVPTKTRLESGIKKFNPHFIYLYLGFEATRNIRGLEKEVTPGEHIPIIAMTGHTTNEASIALRCTPSCPWHTSAHVHCHHVTMPSERTV